MRHSNCVCGHACKIYACACLTVHLWWILHKANFYFADNRFKSCIFRLKYMSACCDGMQNDSCGHIGPCLSPSDSCLSSSSSCWGDVVCVDFPWPCHYLIDIWLKNDFLYIYLSCEQLNAAAIALLFGREMFCFCGNDFYCCLLTQKRSAVPYRMSYMWLSRNWELYIFKELMVKEGCVE